MIYVLNNASIVGITDDIEKFLKSYNLNDKAILQTKLACEEVLLKYQEVFMQNSRVKLRCSRTLRRLKVELSVAGGSMNPFADNKDEQEYSDVLHAVLVSMGVAPSWQYKNGGDPHAGRRRTDRGTLSGRKISAVNNHPLS